MTLVVMHDIGIGIDSGLGLVLLAVLGVGLRLNGRTGCWL